MDRLFHQTFNSQGNRAYNAVLYRGTKWGTHFHRNPELIYAVSGSLSVSVGAGRYTLAPGDFCMILPGRVHAIDPQPDAVFWIGVFSEDHVPFFAAAVRERDVLSPVFRCDEATERYLAQKMIDASPSATERCGLLALVCAQFLMHVSLVSRSASSDPAIRAFEYIAENHREEVTLKSAAAALGYEYHYLSRCVSRTLSMNFRRIVNLIRCEHAVRCMEQGSSVLDAAFDSGFQSLRTFNAAFHEITGCCPSDFMRRSREAARDGSFFT